MPWDNFAASLRRGLVQSDPGLCPCCLCCIPQEGHDHAHYKAIDGVQEHTNGCGEDEKEATPLIAAPKHHNVADGRHADGGKDQKRSHGSLGEVGEDRHRHDKDQEHRHRVDELRHAVGCLARRLNERRL